VSVCHDKLFFCAKKGSSFFTSKSMCMPPVRQHEHGLMNSLPSTMTSPKIIGQEM